MRNTSEAKYGRLGPMLAAIEALVRCESPSEDLAACQNVVRLASDIATRVLGTPAQIKEVEGRPVFGGAQLHLKFYCWLTSTPFGLMVLILRFGK